MDNRQRLDTVESASSVFGNNFEIIKKETESYAQRRGNSDFSLLLAVVKCAFGILILSGYHRVPSRRNYWYQKPDMLTKIISVLERTYFIKFKSSFMLLTPITCPNIQKQDMSWSTFKTLERISKLTASGIKNLIQTSAWWSILVDVEPV